MKLYLHGRTLLSQGKLDEALSELEASVELMPSPNTELLVAHALRQLGRKADAMQHYEHVIADAAARVRQGEKRYQPTLEEAGRWSASLRAELGQLVIVVRAAAQDVRVLVDGAEVKGERDEGARLLRVRRWHDPGKAEVTVRAGEGAELVRTVPVEAGQTADLELEAPRPSAAGQPGGTDEPALEQGDEAGGELPMPPLASWIAAGVGVVGFAFFAGFGASSASRASTLDECAPRCTAALREDADTGKTYQTVANVSVVIGAVGLAAAGTIWLVDALSGGEPTDGASAGDAEPESEESEPSAEAFLAPTGILIRGRF